MFRRVAEWRGGDNASRHILLRELRESSVLRCHHRPPRGIRVDTQILPHRHLEVCEPSAGDPLPSEFFRSRECPRVPKPVKDVVQITYWIVTAGVAVYKIVGE
jgi:hypothetical protein